MSPHIFVTALVASTILTHKADELKEAYIYRHLTVITSHFSRVTSNLMNEYQVCSKTVANSFKDKDTPKVQDAIQALITGHNKQNTGTMQRFFDLRDLDNEKLKTEEINLSSSKWIDV